MAQLEGRLLAFAGVAKTDLFALAIIHEGQIDCAGKGPLGKLHGGAGIHQGQRIQEEGGIWLAVGAHGGGIPDSMRWDCRAGGCVQT